MRSSKTTRPIPKLTVHRIRLDLSMNQLAARAGLSIPSISRIERGQQPITPEVAVKLAKAFDLSARAFTKLSDDLPHSPGRKRKARMSASGKRKPVAKQHRRNSKARPRKATKR